MFNDLINKKKGFADFVQASKYKTEGVNNVGLRELLMEPIQRIPRYTMIWQCASPHSFLLKVDGRFEFETDLLLLVRNQ
jgi:hypothetical protein